MALPPINQEQFLKRLGQVAATKTASATQKTTAPKNNATPAPATSGLQGLLDRKKTESSGGLGLKLLSTALKPLTVLDTPRRAIISGVREIADALDSDPNTNASWGDFKNQTLDASYGFGTAFPMKGLLGKIVGFTGDVLFDPLTYATLGSTVAKKAVMSTGVKTRAALGGVKNVSGRQGRAALAKLSRERLDDLARKGMKFEKGQVDTIVRDIYAKGKNGMPGFLKDDIGIKGPGIYYFGSRVKIPGSGIAGDFLERKLISTRLSLVSPRFKVNPGQFIHRAITPDGTFQLARVEPEKILEYRVGLANGTLEPRKAAMAAGVLEMHESERLVRAKALEFSTQQGFDVVADPAMQTHKTNLHNIIETGGTLGPDDRRLPLIAKTIKYFKTLGDDIQADFNDIDAGGPQQALRPNYVPHMESDTTIVNKAKIGEEAWARSVGDVLIGNRQKNASSFRGRKYKKGDLFFGYILDADKTIDELNLMARKPGDVLNPATGMRYQAINYDYYETDMTKILNKYTRHYSQQKGYAAFVRTGLQKGSSFMKMIEKDIPIAAEYAMERAGDLPRIIASAGSVMDEIAVPLIKESRTTALPQRPFLRGASAEAREEYDRLRTIWLESRAAQAAQVPPKAYPVGADMKDSTNLTKLYFDTLEKLKAEDAAKPFFLRKLIDDNDVYKAVIRDMEDQLADLGIFADEIIGKLKENPFYMQTLDYDYARLTSMRPGRVNDVGGSAQMGAALRQEREKLRALPYSKLATTEPTQVAPTPTANAIDDVALNEERLLQEDINRKAGYLEGEAPVAPRTPVAPVAPIAATPSMGTLLNDTETKMNQLRTIFAQAVDGFENGAPESFQNLLNTFEELSDRLKTRISSNVPEKISDPVEEVAFIEKFGHDIQRLARDTKSQMELNNYVFKPTYSQIQVQPTYGYDSPFVLDAVGAAVNGDVESVDLMNTVLKNFKDKILQRLPEDKRKLFQLEIDDAARPVRVTGSLPTRLLAEEKSAKNFRARLTNQSLLARYYRAAKDALKRAEEFGVLESASTKQGGARDKIVYSIDEIKDLDNFQSVKSIVSPQTKATRAVEAGFGAENAIYYSEALRELQEVVAIMEKGNYGAIISDDYIKEVLQKNLTPLRRSNAAAVLATDNLILQLKTIDVTDVKKASQEIDRIFGRKNVVLKFLNSNLELDPYYQFAGQKYENKKVLKFLKDTASPNSTSKDIERFLKLHLGDGALNDGILPAKKKLYQIRQTQIDDPAFGNDIYRELFPVHKIKTTQEFNQQVSTNVAVVAHNQSVKNGPLRSVIVTRQKELEGLPTLLKKEFAAYINAQKTKAKEFRTRINDVIAKRRVVEKELSDFQTVHLNASDKWASDFQPTSFYGPPKSSSEWFAAVFKNDIPRNVDVSTVPMKQLFENKANRYFPKAKSFINSFFEENKNTLNFIAEIEETGKTGLMSEWDFRIGISIIERNYSKKSVSDIFQNKEIENIYSRFFNNPTDVDVSYEEFKNIVVHTLSVKFFDDIDNAIMPTLISLEKRVAAQDDLILRLTSKAIISEKEVLNATPNNVFQKNRNRLAPVAKEPITEATTQQVNKKTGKVTTFLKAQGRQNELEQSDFYPFAKSQEKRANTLLALSEFDGDKIDWTLGGQVELIYRNKPLSFDGNTWSRLINVDNLSSSPGDELDYITSWLTQNDVKQIILGEDFAKVGTSISDEEMLNRFVSYVYKNQKDAITSPARKANRNNFITSAWKKSDANKVISEIAELKKLIADDLMAKQAQDPVRAIDGMLTKSDELSTRRATEEVAADEWFTAYGITTDDVIADAIDVRNKFKAQVEKQFVEFTPETRPLQRSPEYQQLIDAGVPEKVLKGSLPNLNNYMSQEMNTLHGLVRRQNMAANYFDDMLSQSGNELAQKSEKQLYKELEILNALRTNNIDTPKTKGKLARMIRERTRILDTRSPAEKEKALAQVAAELEEARKQGTNMLPGGRQQIERMVNPPADPEYIGADMIGRPGDQFFDDVAGGKIQEEMAGNPGQTRFYDDLAQYKTISSERLPASTPATQRRLPVVEPRYDYNPAPSNRGVNQYNPNLPYGEQLNLPKRILNVPEVVNAADTGMAKSEITSKFESAYSDVSESAKLARIRFLEKSNKGNIAANVDSIDTAALEQIENAKQVLKKVANTENATPVEKIVIDIGVKQAEILDVVSKLPVEEVDARLLDGMSGNIPPIRVTLSSGKVVEVPFPDAGTMIKGVLEDGWRNLNAQFPNIQVTSEFKEIWEKARYFEDPKFVKMLTNHIGGFTKFHKAYATLTPGFHVRNMIGNTFQYVLAGGKIENLKPATKIHFDWLAAYKRGDSWKQFLTTLDPADAAAATVARNAMLGSGGGIYGDVFHEVIKGNKIYDNRLTRFSKKYGQMSDNMSRFVLGFDSAKQGMDSNMATARVRKFYFDYEDLSKLDRTMKQFVPFWIWTSRNLPLQLENMWLNPKPYLLYNSFVRNIRDKESEKRSPLPSFIQEVGGFKLPGVPAYAAPDLNFTRVPQLISQLGNVKKLGTNFNPLLRIPIEQAIGQNLYNDKEIVSGEDRLINLLQGLVVPVATGDRLLNSYGDAKYNAWLGFFGSPIKKIKKE
jgi:hypothetical protein